MAASIRPPGGTPALRRELARQAGGVLGGIARAAGRGPAAVGLEQGRVTGSESTRLVHVEIVDGRPFKGAGIRVAPHRSESSLIDPSRPHRSESSLVDPSHPASIRVAPHRPACILPTGSVGPAIPLRRRSAVALLPLRRSGAAGT